MGEIVYTMAETDARVGTCGLHDEKYNLCRKPGVIRVEVETREYDIYEETSEFHPYTGETVMVDVCAGHKARMEAAYVASKQHYQDRVNKRDEQAALVASLKQQLADAEDELHRM